jgi:hypothetical protein
VFQKIWELTWQEWVKGVAKALSLAFFGLLIFLWPALRHWLGSTVWLYGWGVLALVLGWGIRGRFALAVASPETISYRGHHADTCGDQASAVRAI